MNTINKHARSVIAVISNGAWKYACACLVASGCAVQFNNAVESSTNTTNAANSVKASIVATPSVLTEATGPITLTVQLDQTASQNVIVPIQVAAGGTALEGFDFSLSGSTVTIPQGGSSGTLTLTIIDDADPELDETFTLRLGQPTNASLAASDTELHFTIQAEFKYYLYVAQFFTNQIYGYEVNTSTGALTAVPSSPIASGTTSPRSLGFDAQLGRALYVGGGGGDLTVFSIEPATGELTNEEAHAGLGCAGAGNLIVSDSAGENLYVGNTTCSNEINRFAIGNLGKLTPLNTHATAGLITSIAIHPSGNFLYSADMTNGQAEIWQVDASGDLTNTGTKVITGGGLYDIAIAPSGAHMILTDHTTDTVLLGIDSAGDGSDYAVADTYSLAATADPDIIAFNPDGRTFTVSHNGEAQGSLFEITSNSLNFLQNWGSDAPETAQYLASGNFMFSAMWNVNSIVSFTVNPSTGALSQLTTTAAGGGGAYSLKVVKVALP